MKLNFAQVAAILAFCQVAVAGSIVQRNNDNDVYIGQVVNVHAIYCPQPTTITQANGNVATVTEPTTITQANGNVATVTEPGWFTVTACPTGCTSNNINSPPVADPVAPMITGSVEAISTPVASSSDRITPVTSSSVTPEPETTPVAPSSIETLHVASPIVESETTPVASASVKITLVAVAVSSVKLETTPVASAGVKTTPVAVAVSSIDSTLVTSSNDRTITTTATPNITAPVVLFPTTTVVAKTSSKAPLANGTLIAAGNSSSSSSSSSSNSGTTTGAKTFQGAASINEISVAALVVVLAFVMAL
ncbi:hypothetical protein SBOR_5187 [Sclerotinia borealis F-4128]|uniref:Uncharacterized protein n=1 Tax=Sclerotinia borealis (strain F-4128) TaxID=1432307 RepID=W9CIG2_SCLBF|nr:hypothetical protein SBOR_5187 [Sclerotinia borealis F-4128]